MAAKEEVTFVRHEPCPNEACGSSDAFARYSDGHGYCFSCEYHEKGEGESMPVDSSVRGLWRGEPLALNKRCITQETCEKFRYWTGADREGRTVQIANYVRAGKVVGQKVRWANKQFVFTGPDVKNCGLYGQHLWRDGGKRVVVTEGEIDALTVSQLQNNRWPVVSVPNGAQGAAKAVRKELEWLESFEKVVFAFDMDEQGQDAAIECAELLTPGKAYIASLPLKDANAMLQAQRGDELVNALWDAKRYRPDGIVSMRELREKAVAPVTWGLSWPWEPLTEATYGIRPKEVYALGAGTGIGKSDVFAEIMAHLITVHGERVGGIMLEQPPEETLRRIAGKVKSKRFHVPDAGWTQDELEEAVDELVANDSLYLYDHFGASDWTTVKARMKYMVQTLGIKYIFLDHLTALAAQEDDERKALEYIMADFGKLPQQLDFTLFFISHLATPEGKPHEEGGRVMIRHYKGSRSIGFWSHFIFGLEREQQAEDEKARHTTTFRILKDRYTGQATGRTFDLMYNQDTGRLELAAVSAFDDQEVNDGDDEIPF